MNTRQRKKCAKYWFTDKERINADVLYYSVEEAIAAINGVERNGDYENEHR